MYAIIEQGGKQQKVTTGDRLRIDQPYDENQKTVTFDRVLLIGGADGGAKIGSPLVPNATVTADVLGPVKGEKLTTVKHRRRKGYHRTYGHRQKYTEVKITAINA